MSVPHFKGKSALDHVIQAQKEGLASMSEIHGAEPSGAASGFADALRETTLLLGFLWELLLYLHVEAQLFPFIMLPLAIGWLAWKGGRGAILGWLRLERLHRIVEEEKFEIEHHRQQEREELRELYQSKGFQGKLLEEVLDVLMADQERLLRVMVQEELGLSLHSEEHPLKQGYGAALGVAAASFLVLIGLWVSVYSPWIVLPILFIASGAISARLLHNRLLPSIIWQLALGVLALGIPFFAWNLNP